MPKEEAAPGPLFDRALQDRAAAAPGRPALTRLAGVWHNLFRRSAEL